MDIKIIDMLYNIFIGGKYIFPNAISIERFRNDCKTNVEKISEYQFKDGLCLSIGVTLKRDCLKYLESQNHPLVYIENIGGTFDTYVHIYCDLSLIDDLVNYHGFKIL